MDAFTEPHFARSALVSIDVQRDVLDGQPLEIAGTSAALPAMQLVVRAFRKARRPIVHVVRLYLADGSNAELCRRSALQRGAQMLTARTEGAEVADGLLPDPAIRLDTDLLLSGGIQSAGDREVILFKPRWGAFFRTTLEEHLRSLSIDTVVFIGCNFPNCPRTSIYEASERDFRVVAVEDAISGLYDQGRRELDAIGVVRMNAAAVAESIAADPRQVPD
jgi:nicotinamidase-related amidase